ncbi:hypothetical protein RFW18_03360 [Metabacillus idriensis]|uniref:hypothetical protein n=1 Tax=Metabacillus idriensis TaxID=324768 RepID=UPI0028137B5C|nr:hypothetical protein [Metabacillus idriensis]MDR0136770.1 hypothetical protein [Metabacillus idriensis]
MDQRYYDLLKEKGGELEQLLNGMIQAGLNQKGIVQAAEVLLKSGALKVKSASGMADKIMDLSLSLPSKEDIKYAAGLITQAEEIAKSMTAGLHELKRSPCKAIGKIEDKIESLEDSLKCLMKEMKKAKKHQAKNMIEDLFEEYRERFEESLNERKAEQTLGMQAANSEGKTSDLIITRGEKREKKKRGTIIHEA